MATLVDENGSQRSLIDYSGSACQMAIGSAILGKVIGPGPTELGLGIGLRPTDGQRCGLPTTTGDKDDANSTDTERDDLRGRETKG